MSGNTTIGYSKFVTPEQLEQHRRVAAVLGGVTVKGTVSPEGGMVWISRTAPGANLDDFHAGLALDGAVSFPSVVPPEQLPAIRRQPLPLEPITTPEPVGTH